MLGYYETYGKLGNLELDYQQNVERLNETMRRKGEIELEIQRLEELSHKLRTSIKELVDSRSNIDLITYLNWRRDFLDTEIAEAGLERSFHTKGELLLISDATLKELE